MWRTQANDSVLQYDVGLCAYVCLMRIMTGFHEELFSDPDTATGLNKVTRDSQTLHPMPSWLTLPRLRQSIDFTAVTQHHDDKLTAFNDEWKQKFAEGDTGGKWGLLCIILRRLIHSSSTLYRILVRFQEFFASFVRARLATGVLEELTCSPPFLKPRQLFKARDAFVWVPIRLRETH
jgi:hypothetical protein